MLDSNFGMYYGGAGPSVNDGLNGLTYALSPSSASAYDLGNGEFSIPDPQVQGQKRRVRIALKSMPQPGGAEGGEWEVQLY